MAARVSLEHVDCLIAVLENERDDLRLQTYELSLRGREVNLQLAALAFQRQTLTSAGDHLHTNLDTPCA